MIGTVRSATTLRLKKLADRYGPDEHPLRGDIADALDHAREDDLTGVIYCLGSAVKTIARGGMADKKAWQAGEEIASLIKSIIRQDVIKYLWND